MPQAYPTLAIGMQFEEEEEEGKSIYFWKTPEVPKRNRWTRGPLDTIRDVHWFWNFMKKWTEWGTFSSSYSPMKANAIKNEFKKQMDTKQTGYELQIT